ncbi:hypothetical protein AWN76_016980 [Rhodothermaceae bacterium RA]|nr:hypothetical protein AWN76_016980 [Rhodothermaceae bacterium RA]
MPTDPSRLIDLFDYTGWANDLILDAMEALEDGTEPAGEALRLMSHVARAQEIWLGRVQGTEAARQPIWPVFSREECRVRAGASLQAWRTHLASCTTEALDEPIAYRNSKGVAFTSTLGEIALHVVNHGTHHRAQVSRILRIAGHPPPATDYIFYRRRPGGG